MLKKILFTIIILSGLLGIVEFIIRVFLPFPFTNITTYMGYNDIIFFHKYNSYGYEISPINEFKPVKLEYDKYGFRGNNNYNQKQDTIFIVGDSFVESRQVEFKNTISEILNNSYDNKNFINAGCSAYTTTTAYLLIKNRILNFKPLKIFFFFSFNDYADNYWYRGGYYTQKNIFTDFPDTRFIPDDFDYFYTKFENLLAINCAIYAYYKFLNKPKFEMKPWKQVIDSDKFYNSPKLVNKDYNDMDDTEKIICDFTHQGLLEISELCKNYNIDLTVFIIPLPVQVSENEWKIGKTTWGYLQSEFILDNVYQKRLLDFFTKNNINAIDLLPFFRKKNEKGQFFYDYDGHFTNFAQQEIAEIIKNNCM